MQKGVPAWNSPTMEQPERGARTWMGVSTLCMVYQDCSMTVHLISIIYDTQGAGHTWMGVSALCMVYQDCSMTVHLISIIYDTQGAGHTWMGVSTLCMVYQDCSMTVRCSLRRLHLMSSRMWPSRIIH